MNLLREAINPVKYVRQSAEFIARHARHVRIEPKALAALAEQLVGGSHPPITWDNTHHFNDGTHRTAQYLLVLDALNFCFWPEPAWDYNRLALALKETMLREPERFHVDQLLSVTEADTRAMLGGADDIPLLAERTMLLRELAPPLYDWAGFTWNMIGPNPSAVELVETITELFPGFRDHAVYRGRPVYFYKRAQIAVGDLWGSFGGQGRGAFHDIDQLTMFADYRVPQILRAEGVLVYGAQLAEAVDTLREIPAGSAQEIEIRGMTIHAVELLRAEMERRGMRMNSVELDWLLWNIGEERQHEIAPHHRTLTIYY